MNRRENSNLQFADRIAGIILIGLLSLPFLLLFLMLVSVPVSAQVTMMEPFVPVESVGYVPVIPTSPPTTPVETQVVLEGVDENGNTIYSTPWVPIDPEDWADGVRDTVSSPGGGSLANLLESAGLDVDRGSGTIEVPVEDPWPPWVSDLGTCQRFNPAGMLGPANSVSFADCVPLVAAYWGENYVYNQTTWVWLQDTCEAGFVRNIWSMRDSATSVVRAGWSPNESQCVTQAPEREEQPEPGEFTDEMARELLMASPPSSPVLPNPPARPVNNYEFNNVINNNITNITTITTVANNQTNNYEATGDIGDVSGGTTNTPSGLPNQTTAGIEAFCAFNPNVALCQEGGEGGGSMEEYCAENPTAVACSVVDPNAEGLTEAGTVLGDLEAKEGEALAVIDGLVTDVESYVPGSGPDVGPSAGTCPIGDIEFSLVGRATSVDTAAVCDGLGGPIRQVIEIAGMVIAAMIIIKGVS